MWPAIYHAVELRSRPVACVLKCCVGLQHTARDRRCRRRTAEPQVAKVDRFCTGRSAAGCVGGPLKGGARPFHVMYTCRQAYHTARADA